MEQIVARGLLKTRPAESTRHYGGHVLIDEMTGEVVYALSDPKGLLERRIGDLVQVHGTVAETGGDIPLLEVSRVD